MAAKKPTITRVRVAREELEKMTKEDLQKCWNLQDQYVDLLETKLNSNSEHTELMSLRESEEKLKQQQLDASRRENILVMRLTTKEHEMQEFAGQIQELKQAQIPTIAQLRSALLDPAVNLLFERMRKEMDSLKARLVETQDELNAWKFTPDSNTGKRLMSKCRLLYQENEELGKIISSGRMAKIEGDLALQKNFSEEMKKSQSELDEFLLELDEDVEGMQSTIYYLQQQLREAKEQISQLQKEKTDQTSLPPTSLVNHVIENSNKNNCKSSPKPNFIPKAESTPPVIQSNDLNGFKPIIKAESLSPLAPEDDLVLKSTEDEPLPVALVELIKVKKEPFDSPKFIVDMDDKPIVKNEVVVNHDKPVLVEENLNVPDIDSSDTSPSRTQDLNPTVIKTKNAVSENSDEIEVQDKVLNSGKRTPEGNRGRKRTRPRTPVEPEISKDESSLPVRKRTRRREAELLQTVGEKQTAVEINTDAEFQAAHTLASWASKQERTEGQPDVTGNSLGNGELTKDDSEDKSK